LLQKSCTQEVSVVQSQQVSVELVRIDDGQLDAVHGWEQITEGVYQRIDPTNGTVSTVSVGESGRHYDHGIAKAHLAMAEQQLANARRRGEETSALRDEIADLKQTVQRLAPKSAIAQPESAVFVTDSVGQFCHNLTGTIDLTFESFPRVGGGILGKVTSRVWTKNCIGVECIPREDAYATGYNGGTLARVRASNIGGPNSAYQYSNNGYVMDMYAYPSSTATVTTLNVADSACTLSGGGFINTTLVSTPYQTCYLYKNWNIVKTCTQVP
jgi:hypothetical protein